MNIANKNAISILVCMTCLFMTASSFVIQKTEDSENDSTKPMIRLPRDQKASVDMFSDEKQTPQKLLLFVRKHHAEQCLQKVICQLSYKETIFGEEGYLFAQRLKVMESLLKEDEIPLYREARIFGLDNKDPENCIERYSDRCEYTDNEIIRIGLRLTSKIDKNVEKSN